VFPRVFAAVDLGASSGRVVAGIVDGDRVDIREIHRFTNVLREQDGALRWDASGLFNEVLIGLQRLSGAESIGIDTWGIDYGLLDSEGRLLAEPFAYRDARTNGVAERVHHTVPRGELYAISGVQFLSFTTIYQLVAEQTGPLWSRASHAVLIPDLLSFWLTGRLRTEVTNASTTGLLDVRSHTWSERLLDALGIPGHFLPELQQPGVTRGLTADGVPVVTVGSHDTASAVVGVPATSEHFCYISCGTWSLVGLELEQPVLTDSSQHAEFTNEVGIDGRIRYLRNVGGLWLLQECLRGWGGDSLEQLLVAAASRPDGGPRIAVVRCILDSLAAAYADAIAEGSKLAAKRVEVVHIVGGGSRNALLCQLTADATGLPVIAGPAEATAFGNIAIQARSCGAFPESLEEIRARIAASSHLRHFDPRKATRTRS